MIRRNERKTCYYSRKELYDSNRLSDFEIFMLIYSGDLNACDIISQHYLVSNYVLSEPLKCPSIPARPLLKHGNLFEGTCIAPSPTPPQ
jgi:hypothetical protein